MCLAICMVHKTKGPEGPEAQVLRRSPDLFNNVKIGKGQLRFIIKHILFYHI